jgi:hypothetical protein
MEAQHELTVRNSASVETLNLPSGADHGLGAELIKTKPPLAWKSLRIDSDEESIGSSLDEDAVDEDEVIFALNEKALAQLPSHLQKIMQQIQAERFSRLSKEDPALRVRPASFCYKHPSSVHEKDSFSVPSWLTMPPEIEYPAAVGNAFSSSLGANDRTSRRWSAQPGLQTNAFVKQRPASVAGYHNRSTQTMLLVNDFRQFNKYHIPQASPKIEKQATGSRTSGFRSLSLKPVASNLRARMRKSIQRLNKLVRR